MTTVLRTRLIPPKLPATCVRRPRLVERIVEGLSGRGVLVVAGPGYGKTTLLAQCVEAIRTPWAWCSCDTDVADPSTFLRHVCEALAATVPGFGADLTPMGDTADDVAAVCNEAVETLPDDLVLILDDAHLLPSAAAAALALLARDLPANVRLLIASRSPLGLGASRTRVGPLMELNERDLMLTDDEAQNLLSAANPGGPALDATDLNAQTEGWVAGFSVASRAGAGLGSGPAVFRMMLDEVLGEQPPELCEFMTATCVLDRFNPEVARLVSDRDDAASLARRLAEERLFTSRLGGDGEWYRYHHLLSAHLRERLADEAPARLRELHRRAASALDAVGEHEAAARHAITAEDWELAVECLEHFVEGAATSAGSSVTEALLGEVPAHVIIDRPPLLLARAAFLLGGGDYEASFDSIEQIIDRLRELGDEERAGVALFRLMQAMGVAGTPPARRVEVGRRHLPDPRPADDRLAMVRIMHAANAAYARAFEEAEAELDALSAVGPMAVGVRTYADVVHAHYLGFARDGRPEARERLDAAIAALVSDPGGDRLAVLPWARMLRCYELLDLGLNDEALLETERAGHEAEQRGLERGSGRPFVWLRAWAHLGLGDPDRADAAMREAVRPAEPGVTTAYSYRYRALAGLLAVEAGDHASALSHVRLGLESMEQFGRVSDDPVFLCDFARVAQAVNESRLAESLALRAVGEADAIGAAWQRLRSRIVAAAVLADDERTRDCLAEALALSADPALEGAWTRRERPRAPRLLARALAEGLGPPGVTARLIGRCGGGAVEECLELLVGAPARARAELADAAADARGAQSACLDAMLRDRDASVRAAARQAWGRLRERPRASITIQTLGGLRIWRDGLPVAESTFERQKARMLLGLLVARACPLHRDAICETIWPHLEPERAAAALRTTLHDLRRALQPELEASSPSAIVASDGETVSLALDAGDDLDLVRLATVASDAEATPEQLQAAEDLVRGSFLPEWLYEDWTQATRRRAEEQHLSILARLAERLASDGRHEAAALRWRRLLEIDPEHERWHRGLMAAYAGAGEKALALRQFHACRTILRTAQGIEPGPETQELYRALLREEAPFPSP